MIFRWVGVSAFVAIRTSSTKSKTLSGYLSWRGRSIFLMARQKVAGELVSLKYMTVGSYNPKGVLKAAFQRSSSLIRMLLNPQRMSNFVKRVFPCKWSKILLMRGSGYVL